MDGEQAELHHGFGLLSVKAFKIKIVIDSCL